MVDRKDPLPVTRQCALLDLPRSTFYHVPKPVSDEELELMTLIDRWILERLHAVVKECRAAYESYDFRKVFIALNQFCAVDLSAQYIDMTKDRMYCDAIGSPRRRAAQTAMHRVLDGLCRLLAPVLAYTADEAWEFLAPGAGSVHLAEFPPPDPDFAGTEATDKVERLLKLRAAIEQKIDAARKDKVIGKSLEAAVTLKIADPAELDALLPDADDRREFFILSDLAVAQGGPEPSAEVARTDHQRCERCWRHLPEVGSVPGHDDLCGRCAGAIGG